MHVVGYVVEAVRDLGGHVDDVTHAHVAHLVAGIELRLARHDHVDLVLAVRLLSVDVSGMKHVDTDHTQSLLSDQAADYKRQADDLRNQAVDMDKQSADLRKQADELISQAEAHNETLRILGAHHREHPKKIKPTD